MRRHSRVGWRLWPFWLIGWVLLLVSGCAWADGAAEAAFGAASGTLAGAPAAGASAVAPAPRWMAVPRIVGRITARELGLVINTADPYSVAVGEFYAQARHLAPAQVLRVELPVRATLTPLEFKDLADRISAGFGPRIQALALAWTLPYAVNCNALTGALALGYDEALCLHSCEPSRLSPLFGSVSTRPFTDFRMRPSMQLAARDIEMAKAMIRRGVAADRSLGLRGAPPANAYYVITPDRARNVRVPMYPPAGLVAKVGIDVHVESTSAITNAQRVLLYMTGLVRVDQLDTVHWLPGALAEHLTSYGGQLDEKSGQMSALEWIASGATASYGTASEPCAHPQKFPHPQLLLLDYAQGGSALEALWRSVAWPQQGVFIGEPLAAPFARQ